MAVKTPKRKFGKGVWAFFGHVNKSPLRPLVSVGLESSELAAGEWLSPQQARALAKRLVNAAAYVDRHTDAVKRREKLAFSK